jgi:CubicO group peptidase (beta-lactamase class C family)
VTFLADLGDRLSEVAHRYSIPGAAIAVRRGDDFAEAATGVLNLATGVETTTDSLFQIGSVTKVYTALLVMQLVDEGLVELDEPVQRYLPAFRVADEAASRTITVRQLLCHTGGFDGDLFEDTGRGDDSLDRYIGFLSGAQQASPPGALFSYANTGYCVLGGIVAKIRGGTWEDNVRARLLEPLGLQQTTLYAEDAIRFRVAMGHMEDPQTKKLRLSPQWQLPRSNAPAGATICAAPRDLIAFGRLFLGHGPSIVSSEALAAMVTPVVPALGFRSVRQWGLGVMLFDWTGTTVYGHDGGTRGQATFLRIVPEHDLVVAASGNGPGMGSLVTDLVGAVIEELTSATGPRPAVPPTRPEIVDVAPFVGRYEVPLTGIQIDAADDGIDFTELPSEEAIRLGASRQTCRFVHLSGDTFVSLEQFGGVHATATFVDGGRYLHTGRAHRRVEEQ